MLNNKRTCLTDLTHSYSSKTVENCWKDKLPTLTTKCNMNGANAGELASNLIYASQKSKLPIRAVDIQLGSALPYFHLTDRTLILDNIQRSEKVRFV